MKILILLVLTLAGSPPLFATEIREFADPDKAARYDRLIGELRCLVCQNQSLADSDADLARDLRNEVYEIIEAGQSEEEAIRFLTDRYGDFVLYRPPVKPMTFLLWGGPLLILLFAGVIGWRYAGQRKIQTLRAISEADRDKLERLKKHWDDGY